jgi:hypothetical protein
VETHVIDDSKRYELRDVELVVYRNGNKVRLAAGWTSDLTEEQIKMVEHLMFGFLHTAVRMVEDA